MSDISLYFKSKNWSEHDAILRVKLLLYILFFYLCGLALLLRVKIRVYIFLYTFSFLGAILEVKLVPYSLFVLLAECSVWGLALL